MMKLSNCKRYNTKGTRAQARVPLQYHILALVSVYRLGFKADCGQRRTSAVIIS